MPFILLTRETITKSQNDVLSIPLRNILACLSAILSVFLSPYLTISPSRLHPLCFSLCASLSVSLSVFLSMAFSLVLSFPTTFGHCLPLFSFFLSQSHVSVVSEVLFLCVSLIHPSVRSLNTVSSNKLREGKTLKPERSLVVL